jgi:hypothetical protein
MNMIASFFVGLVVGMILLLLGQRITLAYKKKDDRHRAVEQVVENYISGKFEKIGYNVPVLLASGAGLLKNTSELMTACGMIVARGRPDPLIWAKKHLSERELLNFVRWHQDQKNYRPDDYFNDKAFQCLVARFRQSNFD